MHFLRSKWPNHPNGPCKKAASFQKWWWTRYEMSIIVSSIYIYIYISTARPSLRRAGSRSDDTVVPFATPPHSQKCDAKYFNSSIVAPEARWIYLVRSSIANSQYISTRALLNSNCILIYLRNPECARIELCWIQCCLKTHRDDGTHSEI